MLGLLSCCDLEQTNLSLSFCTTGLSPAQRTLHRAVSPGGARGCMGAGRTSLWLPPPFPVQKEALRIQLH